LKRWSAHSREKRETKKEVRGPKYRTHGLITETKTPQVEEEIGYASSQKEAINEK